VESASIRSVRQAHPARARALAVQQYQERSPRHGLAGWEEEGAHSAPA